jgi:hypothetical protein
MAAAPQRAGFTALAATSSLITASGSGAAPLVGKGRVSPGVVLTPGIPDGDDCAPAAEPKAKTVAMARMIALISASLVVNPTLFLVETGEIKPRQEGCFDRLPS